MNDLNELMRYRIAALDDEVQKLHVKLIDKDRELNRAIYKLNILRNETESYKLN